MSAPVDSADRAHADRAHVTAVVVAHDGERWIPQLTAALSASTRAPDEIVAVDTDSADRSRALLVAALGAQSVVDAPRDIGFGAAVQFGIAACAQRASSESWIWLLHDDCAPAADTLARLLDAALGDESIGVLGCRMRAWPRGRRLLEVGVTITGTGHRETGLEPGEYDQGQYEHRPDVLAVSSAGMLVRRSVWDELGGLEPQLPLFRDDVDFGWRAARLGRRVVVAPGAVVFHAEAAARDVRQISNTATDPHQADRRAALFTLLANCRAAALPVQYVRLLVGSLVRAVGFLVGKLPGVAWRELAAAGIVLGRPDRIMTARRNRRRISGGDPATVRLLLPPWWKPYANGVELVASQFSGGLSSTAAGIASSTRLLRAGRGNAAEIETGPVADEAVNLATGSGPVNTVRSHPLLMLLGLLTLAGLLASRSLLGGGFLQGGGLLPAPDSAADWWRLYGEAEHSVRLGSTLPTSPYVVALAIGGALLLGKAWLLTDLLVLFAPVLAAAGAFVGAGRFVRSVAVRVWMATAYALLPVLTGASGAGRVGTVVATIVLPWLVLPVSSLVRGAGRSSWGPICGAAAVLAVLGAFTPVAVPIAAAVVLVAVPWLLLNRRARTAAAAALSILLSVVLLLPWSKRFLATPELLLTEAGSVELSTRSVDSSPWHVLFGRVGASAEAPWWLSAGLLLAALLALLRSDTRGRVAAAWVVAGVGLVVAAVMARGVVTLPGGRYSGLTWLGFPVTLAQAGLIVAVGLGADRLTRSMGSGSFGWRQPTAAVAVAAAVSVPVAGLVWWAAVASNGELDRKEAVPLPAYMVDFLDSAAGSRVLVIRSEGELLTYDIVAGDGLRLGDDSVLVPAGSRRLTRLVTGLLTPGQPVDAAELADFGFTYVVQPRPVDPAVVARLDALAGLTRASTAAGELAGWQVEPPSGGAGAGQLGAGSATGGVAPDSGDPARRRHWELAGQGALWLVVMIGAAPGRTRRAQPLDETS